jgi:cell division septation protein DedD
VVTYRQPQLAKRELERLQAKGERAFLMSRKGLTVLCVGPFPSKDNAKEKLVQLKDRYQGCFLKTL